MQNLESESNTEKEKSAVKRTSKNKRNLLLDETSNDIEHQKKIAISAYYKAEKRGFVSSEADAVHDWLEAEKEVNNSIIN